MRPKSQTWIAVVMLQFSLALFCLAQNPPTTPAPAAAPEAQKASAGTPASYVLGPEDQFAIQAVEIDEISKDRYRVDGSGNVNIPLAGQIHAGGLTVEQFEAVLVSKLKTYVREPQVSISVTEFRSQPVSVLGAVNTPGVQMLQGKKTLAEVLSLAGGLKPEAGYSVRITRKVERGPLPLPGAAPDPTGKFYIAQVNLNDLLTASKPELNIVVQPEDIISVPRGQLIYVVGEVKKSGGFVLSEQETVSTIKALAMAEGLVPTAKAKSARILRVTQGAARQEIPVDLNAIMSGKAKDVAMQSDDILLVPRNTARVALASIIDTSLRMAIYRLP